MGRGGLIELCSEVRRLVMQLLEQTLNHPRSDQPLPFQPIPVIRNSCNDPSQSRVVGPDITMGRRSNIIGVKSEFSFNAFWST